MPNAVMRTSSAKINSLPVEKAGTTGSELIFADEVRITAFGIYLLDYLCSTFTYLDLVSLDCGLSDEKLYHEFCRAAAGERVMGTAANKRGRLESRLKRAKSFVKYLHQEESREKAEFLLNDAEEIMASVNAAFEEDRLRALASAKRNS